MSLKRKKPTQRSINAQNTKNNIFEAAIKLFKKYGYDRVTVEDITDNANVSKGNFYTHFPSKDSVLAEQFNRIDQAYVEAFASIDESYSASDKIQLLVKVMCEYINNVCGVQNIKLVYSNQITANRHTDILGNTERPFYKFIREAVVQGQKSGEFRDDASEDELVNIVARFLRALIYDWCLYDEKFNLNVEWPRHLLFILSAISKNNEKK